MKTMKRLFAALLLLASSGCAAYHVEYTAYVQNEMKYQIEGMTGPGTTIARVEAKLVREPLTHVVAKPVPPATPSPAATAAAPEKK